VASSQPTISASSSRLHRRERIETLKELRLTKVTRGSSRLHRRERIETSLPGRSHELAAVPPGFIAGSGLKQIGCAVLLVIWPVPPGFIAGSGLKLTKPEAIDAAIASSSRLHRRERIETYRGSLVHSLCRVPPGFIAGSGLKRATSSS